VNLSRWSLRYPVTAGMTIVTIVVLGALAATRLPLAFLPEVDFPGLEIVIPYPNALPNQVEEEITRPAEEALATMSRVRRMESWSSAQAATISIQFDWGEDVGPLRVEAREKLERIRDRLPADVDRIQVNGFRSSDIPVLECRIAADRDLSRDFELLDRHVADPLRRVPGVAKVELYGVERPEVRIDLHLAALQAHGLDPSEVLASFDAANRSLSAGRVHDGGASWPLRVQNSFASVEDMRRLPVTPAGLTLGDVATLSLREPDLDYGRHLDRSRAIGLNVIKESGAHTVAVVDRAREVLDGLRRDPNLRGVRVLTFTDQGEEIRNSLRGLLEAGLIGAGLAVVVLFLFLRRVGATLVVALAIPVSLLAACAGMYFTGRSLNILSMMGLMLGVGMLVDNAVVVLESIYRLRQAGRGPLRAALEGAREVLPAVTSATATSIIVFLPLVLGGRTEITTWIGEVGRTIIMTLTASLFLSLTAIPLAMGRLLRPAPAPRSRAIEALTGAYRRLLQWTLRHRPATLAAAFLVVALAVFPFLRVDKSAFGGTKVESVQIRYEFADNVNFHETERYVARIEDWIHARMESLHVSSTYSYFGNNEAFTRAYLEPGHRDDDGARQVRAMLRKGLPELPGLRLDLRDPNENSGPSRLTVRVFGDPGPRLTELAEEVRRRLDEVQGLEDLRVGGDKGREEIQVAVARDRAARAGVTPRHIAESMALFFRGRPLARHRGENGEVEVRARLAEADRRGLEPFERMPVITPAGTAPLAAFATFHAAETPASIQRQQRRSVTTVSGSTGSSQSGEVRREVTRALAGMTFPPGYSWSFGSAFEEESRTQQEMLVNLLLALCLVYLVMAGLFESLLHPFAIMLALPFAFVGIAWTCFLTGSPFNLMAQIGLLILIGIVVNNGIVLIHKVHHLRSRGVERPTALLEAARDRLRPILMTTLTTVLGLLPLAVGSNHVGDVLYFPLARTVMGGLVSATVLTLVLVPCLYTLLEDGADLVARTWRVGARRA
jgi:HAE1 family hydrophobic/amphiphilic exporter-1